MPDDFEVTDIEIPPLRAGQILVENLAFSVDPYMRGRMNDGSSYTEPFELGKVMTGSALGRVIDSSESELARGSLVRHEMGWRTHAVLNDGDASAFTKHPEVGLTAYLGVLGMPGFAAWVGVTDVLPVQSGDTVLVSSAAGAVGSLVGQLARLRGAAMVVGTAGTTDKRRWLTEELGFDAAVDYHGTELTRRLTATLPSGVDYYFDNVGGEHLAAALDLMNTGGRIAACGAVGSYNDELPPPGPRNLLNIVTKRLTIRGFVQLDHQTRWAQFAHEVEPLVASGAIRCRETVIAGIHQAPAAFISMLDGGAVGKTVVRTSAP